MENQLGGCSLREGTVLTIQELITKAYTKNGISEDIELGMDSRGHRRNKYSGDKKSKFNICHVKFTNRRYTFG